MNRKDALLELVTWLRWHQVIRPKPGQPFRNVTIGSTAAERPAGIADPSTAARPSISRFLNRFGSPVKWTIFRSYDPLAWSYNSPMALITVSRSSNCPVRSGPCFPK